MRREGRRGKGRRGKGRGRSTSLPPRFDIPGFFTGLARLFLYWQIILGLLPLDPSGGLPFPRPPLLWSPKNP